MARTLKSDKMLFLATLVLVGASVVMVYSASAVQAEAKYQMASLFMYKQLAWAIVGVTLMLGVMHIDYKQYRRPELIWGLLGVTMLLLLAVFLFAARNGTQRWIGLGFVSVQPSELAKLAAILFTAAILDGRMHRVNDAKYTLAPIAGVALMLAFLIYKEPDFGTAVVLLLVVATMAFAAGLSYRYLGWLLAVAVPAAAGAIVVAPYRLRRLLIFMDPWKEPLGDGFQIIQALFAFGSGGVLGKGLMGGIQKLYYIPEPHTDFIYAVIAEELGLVGTTVTLLCFGLIGWRGLRAAILAPDRFGSLLALGITMMMTLQALVNMSVVAGLMPTKGIPLPFVSNGGSSLVINLVAMGILLNISQQASATAAAAIARPSDWQLREAGGVRA